MQRVQIFYSCLCICLSLSLSLSLSLCRLHIYMDLSCTDACGLRHEADHVIDFHAAGNTSRKLYVTITII